MSEMSEVTKAASVALVEVLAESGTPVTVIRNVPTTIVAQVANQLPKGPAVQGNIGQPGQVVAVARPGVAQLVRVAAGTGPKAPPMPAGMKSASTNTVLDDSFFRAVLYGTTSSKKTTTAAEFEDPEFVRIILTRDESQLIPLAGQGYQYVKCDSASKFEYAMKYPEAIWPEWGGLADPQRRRTIIVDDLTKALDVIVKSATAKDNRMAYRDAKNTLDDLVTSLSSKPYNIILITLAKIGDNIRDEEQIGPEMSPSLRNYIEGEFSAVLFVDATKNMILTDREKFGIAVENADGKVTGTKNRIIFSKTKLPKMLVGKGLINLWEPRDLRAFWKKLKSAQLQAVTGGKK